MNRQLANLSVDLRRISYWIYQEKTGRVEDYVSRIRDKYKIKNPVGIYKDVWKEIDLIKEGTEGRLKSADRAATLSSILLHESMKI